MKKIFRSISFILALALAFLLLGATATAYISPVTLHVFTLAGFGFPALWMLNLILLVWFLIRKRQWFALIPLPVLLLTINHWNNTFQMRGRKIDNTQTLELPLKVMSYNTRMFDYYRHSGMSETPDNIYDFITSRDPDVVCFQEFYSNVTRPQYNPSYIMARFKQYKFKHIEYVYKSHSGSGIATFSKYPIVDKGDIRFEQSNNMSIYTDINVKGKVVRVFNNHLESIGFRTADLQVLDSLEFRINARQRQGLERILQKLNRAFAMRAEQSEVIARHIANSPYPVIVCGDFNDTPVSYVYRTMRGKLRDAFRESGFGFGGTYNGKLPSLRIDYIFHSPEFDACNFTQFNVKYSDHYPIMTTINLKK
ncbi:MAG: endonuclease/exonuclease/phosphatase family protein [Cytophagaceae bacterium]|jgi:endonuclease/exonuclease/phosphatase family metal-dependent hydrolase|nr:endonuclease/exonuclease/phosphatase family protein [Cytophagaceae bacterium]